MKQIIFCVAFLIIALSNVSCEKFLERPPLDAIGNDDYWKTAGDLEKYVLQFYSQLPGHADAMVMALEDANSDNLVLAVPNLTLNGERVINTGSWTSEWANIRNINIFFDQYHNVEAPFDAYRHFLGEAHFFKAWFYFGLLVKYGDIPWYTSALQPGSDELYNPRTPRTIVADSILSHLDKSIDYLNNRRDAGNARLNKEAALAFKTRVALFEGSWQKYHEGTPYATVGSQPEKYFQACVDAANELISGNDYVKGIYSTGNPEADYYTLFGMDNMSSVNEVLLYNAYNASDAKGNNVQMYTTVRTREMAVTWQLVSSYLGRDGIPYDYVSLADQAKGSEFLSQIARDCDPRLHATIWVPGDLRAAGNASVFDKPFIDQGGENLCATGFQVKKFSNPYSPAAGGDQFGGFSETGYIIFRYAEVLLNLAEAQYELDQSIAHDALNQLRLRAGMPEFNVFSQSIDPNKVEYGYPVSDELYEIRRERRIELALEGRRADDYRRWAAHALFRGQRPYGYPFDQTEFPDYHPPLETNGLIDYFESQLPNGYRFREDQDYLIDIPQLELTLNPNLTQNPGW